MSVLTGPELSDLPGQILWLQGLRAMVEGVLPGTGEAESKDKKVEPAAVASVGGIASTEGRGFSIGLLFPGRIGGKYIGGR